MNKNTIDSKIAQIKNATEVGENTAERVGDALQAIAENMANDAYYGSQYTGNEQMTLAELNEWLDNVKFENTDEARAKIGYCKMYAVGINVDVHNIILSWTDNTGGQLVCGCVKISESGKNLEIDDEHQYRRVYRVYDGSKWGYWQLLDGTGVITLDELDSASEKLKSIRYGWTPCEYTLARKASTGFASPIGVCRMYVDISGRWLHQEIRLSCGVGTDGAPDFTTSSPEVWRIFHRCYTGSSWTNWQEIGGTETTQTIRDSTNGRYKLDVEKAFQLGILTKI